MNLQGLKMTEGLTATLRRVRFKILSRGKMQSHAANFEAQCILWTCQLLWGRKQISKRIVKLGSEISLGLIMSQEVKKLAFSLQIRIRWGTSLPEALLLQGTISFRGCLRLQQWRRDYAGCWLRHILVSRTKIQWEVASGVQYTAIDQYKLYLMFVVYVPSSSLAWKILCYYP